MNLPAVHPRAPDHVIETLCWTSTGGDRAQAVAHQARVSEYLRGPGRQLLDRLFTRVSPPDEAWRLDTLEVDLGRLPATASFAEWSVRLEQALWLRLHDARRAALAPARTAGAADLQPSGERALEHFLHYLQRGHLPWSVNPQAGRELAQWLERLAQRFGLGLWTRLQRLHPAGDVLFRLGRIAPHHGLQALLAVRDPELAASLQLLDTQLLAPLHARGRLSVYQLQAIQQAWRVAGLEALWGRYAGGLSADRVRRLREALAASLDQQLGHDWRRVLRQHRRRIARHTSGNALRDSLLQHLLHPGRGRRRAAALPPDTGAPPWPAELRPLLDLLAAPDPPAPDVLCARIAMLRARHPRALQAALRPLALQRARRREWRERWGLPALWPWLAALAAPTVSSHRSASARTGAPLDPSTADAVRLPAGAAWAESLRQFALRTLIDGRLGRDPPGLSALQAWLADASVLELALGERPPQDHAGWTRLWQRALRRWPGPSARAHAAASTRQASGASHDTGSPEDADATTAAAWDTAHGRIRADAGQDATAPRSPSPARHDVGAAAHLSDAHGIVSEHPPRHPAGDPLLAGDSERPVAVASHARIDHDNAGSPADHDSAAGLGAPASIAPDTETAPAGPMAVPPATRSRHAADNDIHTTDEGIGSAARGSAPRRAAPFRELDAASGRIHPGTPDPGTPDPGTPDPGTPTPVTPAPDTRAPVTHAAGTLEPRVADATDVASTAHPRAPHHPRAPRDTPPPSGSAQGDASHTRVGTAGALDAAPAPAAARSLDTPHAAVLAALACAREGAPPPDTATRLRLLDALADASTCAQWLRRSTPAQRWTLLERLLPREAAPLRVASRHLQHAHALACPAKPEVVRERQHWQFLARHLLGDGLPAQPALLARRYALHLAAAESTAAPRPSALSHWRQRLRRALGATAPATPSRRRSDRALAAMQRALRAPPTKAECSELVERARSADGSPTATARPHVPGPATARTSTRTPPPAVAAAAASPMPDPEVRHYLDNAGLVLLATWTPRLFARLDLLDGNRLRDPAALARAVRCLAWLVHGHDRASEPECVLPKLLCGLEITAPLVPSAPLETDTCTLLDGLLQSVIAHWSALGQTSLDGLRQTFLQREGRLAHLPESTTPHWHLAVSPGPFDMLLDRLPWSVATLKLPWMPEVLHVQWR